MNNVWLSNILRFVFLLLLQCLVLKNIVILPPFIQFIIYPLFILMLPFSLPPAAVIFLGFTMGIFVDVFYDSLGLHAAALVITAFARGIVSRAMEPRGGYKSTHTPTVAVMGTAWFVQYASILMVVHLLFYFFYSVFLFSKIGIVFLQTVLSLMVSMILIILYQYIVNPKQ
ncbi:MAG: hypothetical protein AAFV80_00150 [Bacteroidota bacterium]